VSAAEEYVKSMLEKILANQLDMSQYVITKGLSKTDEQYKRGGTNPAHVALKQKIAQRSSRTGEIPPETGDRVPFVMVVGPRGSKVRERSEDPMYALKNAIPLDTEYYITKQIRPAVARIFTAVYEPHRCPEIKGSLTEKAWSSFIVTRRLFNASLPHMRKRTVARNRGYGMGQHAIVLGKCIGCGVKIDECESVCAHCDPEKIQADLDAKQRVARERADSAWDICRRCQGGSFDKVTCSNMHCENFFHRQRVLMDVEDLVQDVKRVSGALVRERAARKCKNATFALMAIASWRRADCALPNGDLLRLIARQIWATREDIDGWLAPRNRSKRRVK